jgi:hypothetical protein
MALAWPTDLVLEDGRFAGFLMPEVNMTETVGLHRVTNPSDRRDAGSGAGWTQSFTWRYLVRTGANLAHATRLLHEAGTVIGDFNDSNVRVTREARATLLDCDSMQISDPGSGRRFFCPVGRPEFTPPELLNADWKKTVRRASGDLFALAIHLYQLLLEGEHPFRGLWRGAGDKPSVPELARQGTWAHQRSGLLSPRPSAIGISLLPDDIIQMFRQAFEDGATNPAARPTARQWEEALARLEQNLVQCPANQAHLYPAGHASCPWCQHAAAAAGRTAQQPLPAAAIPFVQASPFPVPQAAPFVSPLAPPTAPRQVTAKRSRSTLRYATNRSARKTGLSRARVVRVGIPVAVFAMIIIAVAAAAHHNPVSKSLRQIRTGECIAYQPDRGSTFSSLPVVSCSEMHWGQFLGLLSIGDPRTTTYPGTSVVAQKSDALCNEAFKAAVGLNPRHYMLVDYPPPEKFWASQRWSYAVCVAQAVDSMPFKGGLSQQPEPVARSREVNVPPVPASAISLAGKHDYSPQTGAEPAPFVQVVTTAYVLPPAPCGGGMASNDWLGYSAMVASYQLARQGAVYAYVGIGVTPLTPSGQGNVERYLESLSSGCYVPHWFSLQNGMHYQDDSGYRRPGDGSRLLDMGYGESGAFSYLQYWTVSGGYLLDYTYFPVNMDLSSARRELNVALPVAITQINSVLHLHLHG